MIHGHPPQPPQPAPHHMAHPQMQPPPPPHQAPPPPHMPHLTNVPPPNVPLPAAMPQPPRDHPGPRISNRHHHYHRVPAGNEHHHSMPAPPHMPIQQQQQQQQPQHGSRKPSAQHYGSGGASSKAMGHPPKPLPYGTSNNSSHHQHSHHQHHQHTNHHSHHGHLNHHGTGAIPVVSAAGPGGSKTRMIPAHEPKINHSHSNAVPQNNTSNAIVVHQSDPVQLSGGIPSSATPILTKDNSSNAAVSSIQTNSASGTGTGLVVVSSGGGGGGGGAGTGGGGGGGGPIIGGPTTSVVANVVCTSDGNLNDSTSQSQLQQTSQLLSSVPETLANTKEKTPMCLVNELARYNKIQHQYRLTGESGPAHKKQFTVTLKLGDEEYTAEGPSIKKAQHSAADEAIGATKYKHPPVKIIRIRSGGKTNNSNITPTVELNALAMKRGEPTVYETEQVLTTIPPKYGTSNRPPPPNHNSQATAGGGGGGGVGGGSVAGGPNFFSVPPPATHYGGYHRNNQMFNNPPPNGLRYGAPPHRRNPIGSKTDYPRGYYYNHHMPAMTVPEVYKVTLHVGERKFLGEGHTLQAARHDAAARALEVLKPITPDTTSAPPEYHDTSIDSDDPNSELKSPISLVHEMALKRKLTVQFEIYNEKGPPHMKVFTTRCWVGNIVTEGEGNGKKLSKKRAAEKMLDELKKLPPPSPEKSTRAMLKQKRKVTLPKKKTRNLIKEKADEDPTDMMNPISRLMQIQQARKEKEPNYVLVEERGVARRREFVMEVTASGHSTTGIGPTKKLAKKVAADNLLVMLGCGRTTVVNTSTSPNKENMSGSANEIGEKFPRKVTFIEAAASAPPPTGKPAGGSGGRQIVPGVLQLNSGISSKTHSNVPVKEYPQESNTSVDVDVSYADGSSKSSAGTGSSTMNGTPSGALAASSTSCSNPDVGRKKEQLMYLAQLLKFEVTFSDFPKGNHGEFLTLVTLSTEPPQLCHGSGASLEESHDEAARGALEILSKIGLDNVKPKGSGMAAPPGRDESKSKSALSNGLQK
ncbi:maternal effect protein staufen-like [Sabethes cyaneus]|uniref:maternal effect protein staufen-like n=1 Tax=Sabethes cyaneus TaxID=53552 RepID=UPI00237D90D8|nr:maternal effect protein staufen-like [Sabethes cyaneus]